MMKIYPATLAHTDDIVALNKTFVAVTSPMDASRFKHLFDISSLCLVAENEGKIVGFVLAMAQGDTYENDNFQWFDDRLNRYVYIDRIVISEDGRGHGIGSQLYAYVIDWAQQQGLLQIAAEMDLMPPNEDSLKFHQKRGFVAIGSRELESGKTVSMQVKNF